MSDDGWIGCDLDGTLAHYDHWRGPEHIGEPIRPMLDRVRGWIKDGKEVRIFTARAAIPGQAKHVTEWLKQHKLFKKGGLKPIDVTATKDMKMRVLYDDRCRQVETNTGRLIGDK